MSKEEIAKNLRAAGVNVEGEQSKGKSQYFTNLDEHESLFLETKENGQVGIKYYQYKKVVNPSSFAASIKLIEEVLNQSGFHLEGRSDIGMIQGEIKESAKGDAQITAEGNNISKVVDSYIAERKRINEEKAKI